MRRAAATILLLLMAVPVWASGCGGGDEGLTPREQSMQATFEGSYQVKGIEDGRTEGVAIFDNGSFRIVEEDAPRMVIYNRETDEGWLVNLAQKSYEAISYDEALLKAGFLPDLVMGPYFELEQFWEGTEFRMDTADGRSIRASLDGPEYLPTSWLAEAQGKPFLEISWEYSRVWEVSPDNFRLPEGLVPVGG